MPRISDAHSSCPLDSFLKRFLNTKRLPHTDSVSVVALFSCGQDHRIQDPSHAVYNLRHEADIRSPGACSKAS